MWLLEPAWLSAGDTVQSPEAFALFEWLLGIFSLAHGKCDQEDGTLYTEKGERMSVQMLARVAMHVFVRV